ncbi:MAG: hypothetical protein O3A46_16415, partial [Candidatus Poribacteria bacterium]|nr:hypothetical protein [Candidatus Poribacteria bacterium]
VVSRYTGSLEWLVALSRRMLKPGGWLLAHKYDDADERAALDRVTIDSTYDSAEWLPDARAVERRCFAYVRLATRSEPLHD